MLISPELAIDQLFNEVPLIDLRAEIEFERSNIPGSLNLPILSTDERRQVGITYKEQGEVAAVALGHELVSAELRLKRIASWSRAFREQAVGAIFCSRGGRRSEIAQNWLAENGIKIPRVRGGYKAIRRSLLESSLSIVTKHPLLIVSGQTGVGKTSFLSSLASTNPIIDLEQCANHFGSAFGWRSGGQPAQATFENILALQLLRAAKQSSAPILIEAESGWIGRCALPPELYRAMMESPVVVLEAPFEERVARIKADYVVKRIDQDNLIESVEQLRASLLLSLSGIAKRLGSLRTKLCAEQISLACDQSKVCGKTDLHTEWICYLLKEYYDPLYAKHLRTEKPRVVCSGNWQRVGLYLENSLTLRDPLQRHIAYVKSLEVLKY